MFGIFFLQVEDNVPLNETYVPNKTMWCSVCASPEHQAHNCLLAETEMGRPLPAVKIASYLPMYKLDTNKPKVVNLTDFSMMSFAKDFTINWSSGTTENCQGFYNRFKEITGLMREELEKDVASELARVRRKRRQKSDDDIVAMEDVVEIERSHEVTEEVGLNNFSFTKEMEKIEENQRGGFHLHLEENAQKMERIDPVIFEDHRKEITEMAERIGVTEEEIMSVRTVEFPIERDDKEEDFIPLVSSYDNDNGMLDEAQAGPSSELSDIQVLMHVPEEKTDAKVFLTKEHSKFLLNEGEDFLFKASQKYDLQLRVVWESIGNMLQMYGLPSKQNIFYNELLEFLRNVTLEDHIRNRNNAFTMPKVRDKLIKFIEEHLQRLKTDKKSLSHLKDLIRKMDHHQRNQQFKSADKLRRQLNTFLLGKTGLRDGKMHLIGIIKQYQALKDEKMECETTEFRETLRQHFMYLFTAYDHENYEGLLNDYEECVQKGRWPIPLRALFNLGNMVRLANDESFIRSDNEPSTSKESQGNDSLLFYSDLVGERSEEITPENESPILEVVQTKTPENSEETNVNNEESLNQTPQEVSVSKNVQEEIVHENLSLPKTPEKTPSKAVPKETHVTPLPKTPKLIVPNTTPVTPQSKSDRFKLSEQSRKIISDIIKMFSSISNQRAISKLKLVEQKANKNQISMEDYESLVNIQQIVRSKIASLPDTSTPVKES